MTHMMCCKYSPLLWEPSPYISWCQLHSCRDWLIINLQYTSSSSHLCPDKCQLSKWINKWTKVWGFCTLSRNIKSQRNLKLNSQLKNFKNQYFCPCETDTAPRHVIVCCWEFADWIFKIVWECLPNLHKGHICDNFDKVNGGYSGNLGRGPSNLEQSLNY